MTENISTEIAVVKADVGNLIVDDRRGNSSPLQARQRRPRRDRALPPPGTAARRARYLAYLDRGRIRLFNKLLSLNLPLSALYQLAAPKTPEAAREAIAERIEAGGEVSVAAVTEAIASAPAQAEQQIEQQAEDTAFGVPFDDGVPWK